MKSSSAEQIGYSHSNNEVSRSRIEEISYIRGIAMLAVVLIHISVVAYKEFWCQTPGALNCESLSILGYANVFIKYWVM